MYKLIILADDFTGALDTGVQLSKYGISTVVIFNKDFNFNNQSFDVHVLVIDMETRHLPPDKAYDSIKSVTERALKAGIKHIYKKTDSGLRGNIGSELNAVIDAINGQALLFIPAYPKAHRTTVNGIHYVDGIPVSKSVFGKDPFDPVKNDNVACIIDEQSSIEIRIVTVNELDEFIFDNLHKTITIFDAVTDNDMKRIAEKIKDAGITTAIAGCAGFAEYLPEVLGINTYHHLDFSVDEGLIVVSGSINRVTMDQINYAREHGFKTITLNTAEKLSDDIMSLSGTQDLLRNIKDIYNAEGRIIIEASSNNDLITHTDTMAARIGLTPVEVRQRIAGNLGRLIGFLFGKSIKGTLVVFGGDTLKAVIDALGCNEIFPLGEIDNGIVMSEIKMGRKSIKLISKSGGFGDIDTILKIRDYKQKESMVHKNHRTIC